MFVTEMLKKHPCDKLMVIGHSFGGMEASYVLQILESLMSQNSLNTEISGLILVQAGGQYQREIKSFPGAIRRFMKMENEISELWPSPIDIFNQRNEIDIACESGDKALEYKLKQRLRKMHIKQKNPLYLNMIRKQIYLK